MPGDSAPLSFLPELGLVSRRRRGRAAGHTNPNCDGSQGCGCSGELKIKLDDGQLEFVDPDSMEDEDQPYVWNRRES